MTSWFCQTCLEDQDGSVWAGWDQETGRCLCEKCRARESIVCAKEDLFHRTKSNSGSAENQTNVPFGSESVFMRSVWLVSSDIKAVEAPTKSDVIGE